MKKDHFLELHKYEVSYVFRDVSKTFLCNNNTKNEHFLKAEKSGNNIKEIQFFGGMASRSVCYCEALRKPPNVPTLTQRFTLGHAGHRPNDDIYIMMKCLCVCNEK